MRIAVASTGSEENSKVSEVGGRAPYYLIFEDKILVKKIENPFKQDRGSGYNIAKRLADEKVDAAISARFGPVMIDMLKKNNIKFVEVPVKSAKAAVEEYLEKRWDRFQGQEG